MTPIEFKEARKALGFTQQKMAEALELDGTYKAHTVRAWENGKRPITGPVRVALRLMLKDIMFAESTDDIFTTHERVEFYKKTKAQVKRARKLMAKGIAAEAARERIPGQAGGASNG